MAVGRGGGTDDLAVGSLVGVRAARCLGAGTREPPDPVPGFSAGFVTEK